MASFLVAAANRLEAREVGLKARLEAEDEDEDEAGGAAAAVEVAALRLEPDAGAFELPLLGVCFGDVASCCLSVVVFVVLFVDVCDLCFFLSGVSEDATEEEEGGPGERARFTPRVLLDTEEAVTKEDASSSSSSSSSSSIDCCSSGSVFRLDPCDAFRCFARGSRPFLFWVPLFSFSCCRVSSFCFDCFFFVVVVDLLFRFISSDKKRKEKRQQRRTEEPTNTPRRGEERSGQTG